MKGNRASDRPPAVPRLPARIHSLPVTETDGLVPDETMAEVESELGQNEWLDPDTGELAEGESPPHLSE